MKIELKELVGYLPYGLNFMAKGELYQMNEIKSYNTKYKIWAIAEFDEKKLDYVPKVNHRPSEMGRGFTINEIKPILRPLDFTKEIEHNGKKIIPKYEFYGNPLDYKIDDLPYKVTQKLLEWHFDIHKWIEKGLAIDINTI